MLMNLAHEIARTTSEIVGYPILITDENGIVIGSANTSRLGTLHEASIEVIETRMTKSHDEKAAERLKGVKPGVTMPIELADRVVGTIGIAGDPREVSKWGLLVKRQAELLLREKAYQQSLFIRERTLQGLFEEMVSFNPHIDNRALLEARAKEHGIDTKVPRIAVCIDLAGFQDIAKTVKESSPSPAERSELQIQSLKMAILESIRKTFSDPADMSLFAGEDKFVVLHGLKKNETDGSAQAQTHARCAALLRLLEQRGISASIGVGSVARDIQDLGQSYRDSRSALRIGKALGENPDIFSIHKLQLEDLLLSSDPKTRKRFASRALKRFDEFHDQHEMLRTLQALCESGFSPSLAAGLLDIHKNTLLYRIEKIRRKTGVDPRDFRSVLPLYIACVLKTLVKAEHAEYGWFGETPESRTP